MKPRYKRMLAGMLRKAKKKKRSRRGQAWHVYMLRCCDQSLYTGITTDMARRFKTHAAGKGARYTRSHRPLELVYQESCRTRAEALVRECKVKSLGRKKKLELAAGFRLERAACA